MRSILAKARIPSSSLEGPVRGRGELPCELPRLRELLSIVEASILVGNVATISKDEVDESPPASSPYHNESPPHRDSDTSLSSQAEGPPSRALVDLHPTPIQLPNVHLYPRCHPSLMC